MSAYDLLWVYQYMNAHCSSFEFDIKSIYARTKEDDTQYLPTHSLTIEWHMPNQKIQKVSNKWQKHEQTTTSCSIQNLFSWFFFLQQRLLRV